MARAPSYTYGEVYNHKIVDRTDFFYNLIILLAISSIKDFSHYHDEGIKHERFTTTAISTAKLGGSYIDRFL